MLAWQGSGEDPLRSLQMAVSSYRSHQGDFAGGRVVKNPPASAGDTGYTDPWSRKIPHAVGAI